MKLLIGNGVIADGMGLFIPNGAILIEGSEIIKIGTMEKLKPLADEYIDVGGRLIMPGFINPHHHLYSALAAGLSPLQVPYNFCEILDYLWWTLDKALDEESTYYSALAGIIDSVRFGVTTIVDHHASMNFVEGSLATIERAFKEIGIRGVLCFETSDRMGLEEAEKHIAENINFYEKHRDDELIKGAFGMHANFTLSEETMKKIAEDKPLDMPIHVHVAEDGYDAEYCREMGYLGAFDRLQKFGLVDENSLICHAIHLADSEFDELNAISPFVVENAESNANNAVGSMDKSRIRKFIIGTDGMSGDMIASWRSHYLLKGGGDMSYLGKVLAELDRLRTRFFPHSCRLAEGQKADIAVLNYVPKTQISNDNLFGHLIFGAKSATAYMTICNGEIVYRDGVFKGIDIDNFYNEVKPVSANLWKRFNS